MWLEGRARTWQVRLTWLPTVTATSSAVWPGAHRGGSALSAIYITEREMAALTGNPQFERRAGSRSQPVVRLAGEEPAIPRTHSLDGEGGVGEEVAGVEAGLEQAALLCVLQRCSASHSHYDSS